ncbi:hypothetical protein HJB78_27190 [Rhizobium lentis]|nr:hypothetical protein [Rhizobium lentis]
MKHRMLRHKAMIQASRYAFGFSGIYDEDEGSKIAELRDVTPQPSHQPPKPPAPPEEINDQTVIEGEIVVEEQEDRQIADEPTVEEVAAANAEVVDDTTYFEQLEDALAVVSDAASLEEVWTEFDPMARFDGKPQAETNQAIAKAIRKRAEKRIGGAP